ncbi:paraquat-inducible protein A [bacterium]|nr:paraquat-inducible protein A [bacterium]MBU1958449.1 paraquat-inducible protein A [bacterium]
MKKNELDKLIICKKCHTLHEKIPLHQGTKALCSQCNTVIYLRDDTLLDKTLALVIAAFISLMVAFQFNIITINVNGLEQSLTLGSLFLVILEHQQYVVGIMLLFLIVIFPLLIIGSMFLLLVLMKGHKAEYVVRRLLILLAHLRPWSMVDIFFISLLVAMVKLFDVAHIELGVSFIAFIFTLILDIIISKNISFYELWHHHDMIYGGVDEEEH